MKLIAFKISQIDKGKLDYVDQNAPIRSQDPVRIMGANSPDPLCELSEAELKHQREVVGRTDPEIQTLNSQIRLQQQSTPKSGVKRKVEETSLLDTPAKKDRILSPQGDSSPWSSSVLSPLGEDWLPVTRRRKSAPKSKTPTILFNPKPSTAGPTPMGPPNQQNKAPELAGTSVGYKQTSTEKQNKRR